MRISVEQLMALLQTSVGAASSKDMIRFYIGVGLEELFRHPWSWTKREQQFFIEGPVTETQLFTWVAGDDFITAAGAMTDVNWTHTGRVVYLDNVAYRVQDVSHRSALRIYLDKRLLRTNTTPTQLTFYRADICVRSNQIVSLATHEQGLVHLSKEAMKSRRFGWSIPDQAASGVPECWSDDQNYFIPKPAYPPVSLAKSPGVLPAGRYHYFYTRYDYETGYESEPGPTLILNHDGVDAPRIQYKDGADRAENNMGSWGMKLYASDLNPDSTYIPMMEVQSREPGTPVTTFVDVGTRPLYSYVEYWRGKQTVLSLWPIPQEAQQVTVSRHEAHGWVPREHHVLSLGDGQTLLGLLTQYVSARMSMSKRDPAAEQQAMVLFNRQLNYEITRERMASTPAESRERSRDFVPGQGLGTDSASGLYQALGVLRLPEDY